MQQAARAARTLAKEAVKQIAIEVPPSVQIAREADQLIFSGPLGTSRLGLGRVDPAGCSAIQLLPEQRQIAVCSVSKPFFGTLCSLIRSKLHGVTQGYLVYLKIQGIGYRASINGAVPNLSYGPLESIDALSKLILAVAAWLRK